MSNQVINRFVTSHFVAPSQSAVLLSVKRGFSTFLKRKSRFLLTLLLLLALSGCRDKKLTQIGCATDNDCRISDAIPASAYRCDTPTGTCFCRTNEACRSTEFCNPEGFCQDNAGCEKNSDCANGNAFCDTTSRQCISVGRCVNDLQCALGEVCDASKTKCVKGCKTVGDCQTGACVCGDDLCRCQGNTPQEVLSCQIGQCNPAVCADESQCKFGEKCEKKDDAGTTFPLCFDDKDSARRPYCDPCTYGAGTETCGTGANYCLIDTAHAGNYYCGVDCSGGETCPRGYGCQDVIVVSTQWRCTQQNPSCPVNPALTCTKDAECKHGGHCVIPQGSTIGACAGKCQIGENDVEGYCSCQVDNDCFQQTCSGNKCSISKKTCVGDSCAPIHCVDFESAGGCLIGQNCAPSNGLTCLTFPGQ